MDKDTSNNLNDRYDLGVLFVHGIGRQQPGSTLVEFGEPIILWLRRWFARTDRILETSDKPLEMEDPENPENPFSKEEIDKADDIKAKEYMKVSNRLFRQRRSWNRQWLKNRDRADIVEDRVEALINAAERDHRWYFKEPGFPQIQSEPTVRYVANEDAKIAGATGPASAEIRVGIIRSGEAEERSWLFAETCWAQSFQEPKYREMLVWSFKSFPLTIGNHFGRNVRFARGVLATTTAIIALLLATIAIPLIILLLIFTLVLAIVPLKAFQQPFIAIQELLSLYLGDSYVLLENPIKSAAIVSQFTRDLGSVSAKCRKVVIVAHSQGAAVTYYGLRRSVPPNLARIVTFGSGLRKIDSLARLRSGFSEGVSSGSFMLIAAAFIALGTYLRIEGDDLNGGSGLLFWGVFLTLAVVITLATTEPIERFKKSIQRILGSSKVDWTDLYAISDPVSNGPLFDSSDIPNSNVDTEGKSQSRRTSEPIVNTGSVIRDHTSYWQNQEEFVSHIVLELAQVPGAVPDKLIEDSEIDLAAIHANRKQRTSMLAVSFWSSFVAIVIVVRHYLQDLVEWALVAVVWATSKLGEFNSSSEASLEIKQARASMVKSTPNEVVPVELASQTPTSTNLPSIEGLSPVFIIVLLYLVGRFFWGVWAHLESEHFFSGLRTGLESFMRSIFYFAAPFPLTYAVAHAFEMEGFISKDSSIALMPAAAMVVAYLSVIAMLLWIHVKSGRT